jgi:putative multiple sugar transport system permease protein
VSSPRGRRLVVGAWQGFWVAYVGIPAFIVTLAACSCSAVSRCRCSTTSRSRRSRRSTVKVASGFLNGLIGGKGYDAFTLLIGPSRRRATPSATFRTRLARITYQQPVESFPLFVARSRCCRRVVMYFAWQLAHARGLPSC